MYKLNRSLTTKFMILNTISSEKVNGRIVYTYPESTEEFINASFVTYGGTETYINDVLTIIETGDIETWFRPDINSITRLQRVEDSKIFKVLGDPEDIEFRHQYLKFKVESLGKYGKK